MTTHASDAANSFSTLFETNPINSGDDSTSWWVSDSTHVTWATDVIGQGKGALKLDNTVLNKPVVTYGPYVPFTSTSLSFSVEVRQDNLVNPKDTSNKTSISVYYYDQDKKAINVPWHNYHDSQQLPEGTADWTSYKRVFTPPAGVAYVRVVANLIGSGTVWVDKVQISPGS